MRIASLLASAVAATLLFGSASAQTLSRGGSLGASLQPDEAGMRVARVAPGGPAETSGLKAEDVVVAIAGTRGEAMGKALADALKKPQTVTFTVLREGAEVEVPVALREKPKESYEGIEVTYGEAKGPHGTHRTIVMKPEGDGPFPVLFYIQGYTCDSVDFWANPQHPVRQFLEGVARRGYVVYRIEKSNLGDSVGEPCLDQDLDRETAGFAAGLEDLKALPFVDKSRVYLFGHSMGGIQAPALAHDGAVDGVIVYGTGALTWLEYWDANVRRQSVMSTADPVEQDQAVRLGQRFNANVLVNRMSLKEFFEKNPDLADAKEQFGVTSDTQFSGRHYEFWQDVYHNEPLAHARDAKTAFLALWGEADYVSARLEHEKLAEVANHYRPGTAEMQVVPQSDHIFFRKASQEESMKTGFTGDFNPAVIGIVADWMDKQGKQ